MRDPRPGDLWSKRTNGGVIVRNVEAVRHDAVFYRNEGGFDLYECLLSTWRMWVRSGAGLDYEGPEPPSGSPVASDEREELRGAVERLRSQIEAMERAYHQVINPTASFYSWQRDWQDCARLVLGLPDDATVQDINLALLLRTENGGTTK